MGACITSNKASYSKQLSVSSNGNITNEDLEPEQIRMPQFHTKDQHDFTYRKIAQKERLSDYGLIMENEETSRIRRNRSEHSFKADFRQLSFEAQLNKLRRRCKRMSSKRKNSPLKGILKVAVVSERSLCLEFKKKKVRFEGEDIKSKTYRNLESLGLTIIRHRQLL